MQILKLLATIVGITVVSASSGSIGIERPDEYENIYLKSESHYEMDGGVAVGEYKSEYLRNEKGLITEELFYEWDDEDWEIDSKTNYSYNNAGCETERVISNYSKTKGYVEDEYQTHTYNENNQMLTEEIGYYEDGERDVSSRYAYQYNGSGLLDTEYGYNGNDTNPSLVRSYTYDDNGNKTKETEYRGLDITFLFRDTTLVYNESGLLTCETLKCYNYDGTVVNDSYEQIYEYDASGNQTAYYKKTYKGDLNTLTSVSKEEYETLGDGTFIIRYYSGATVDALNPTSKSVQFLGDTYSTYKNYYYEDDSYHYSSGSKNVIVIEGDEVVKYERYKLFEDGTVELKDFIEYTYYAKPVAKTAEKGNFPVWVIPVAAVTVVVGAAVAFFFIWKAEAMKLGFEATRKFKFLDKLFNPIFKKLFKKEK